MKNTTISLIRLLSMLMIIFCHILQGLGSRFAFWINVGVQIFLFISGFLYGNKKIEDINSFYKKRILKILLPYSIFSIIVCLIEYVFLNKKYSFSLILGNVLGFGGLIGTYSTITHTWFISYILFCYFILPLLYKLFNDNFYENLKTFIIISLLLQLLQYYLILKMHACWIINFILGYFYSKSCKDRKDAKKINILIFFLFLIVMPFAIIYQESLSVDLPYIMNLFSKYIINYGHVLLGSVIFIILYYVFNNIQIKYSRILKFSDKYSYYIYLVHQLFILNSFSLLFYTKYLIINIFLIFALSILSAIILKPLCTLLIKQMRIIYFWINKKIEVLK